MGVQDLLKCVEDVSRVVGIGFDATCSLVLLDKARQPLSVSKSGTCLRCVLRSYADSTGIIDGGPVHCAGQAARNVIMWCDHRAQAQADRLRRSDSPAVAHVVRGAGGHLSPELDVPKLMWLNEVLLLRTRLTLQCKVPIS